MHQIPAISTRPRRTKRSASRALPRATDRGGARQPRNFSTTTVMSTPASRHATATPTSSTIGVFAFGSGTIAIGAVFAIACVIAATTLRSQILEERRNLRALQEIRQLTDE